MTNQQQQTVDVLAVPALPQAGVATRFGTPCYTADQMLAFYEQGRHAAMAARVSWSALGFDSLDLHTIRAALGAHARDHLKCAFDSVKQNSAADVTEVLCVGRRAERLAERFSVSDAKAEDDWRERERLSLLGIRDSLKDADVTVERSPLYPDGYLDCVTLRIERQPGYGEPLAERIRSALSITTPRIIVDSTMAQAMQQIVAVTQKLGHGSCDDCYTAACIANGALARIGGAA